MKVKGEFETAKKLYRRAVAIEDDNYTRNELLKLSIITNKKMTECLEGLLIELGGQEASRNND